MFTRQAVNSLKESSDYEANPRRRFLCRRSAIVDKTYHPSPAKGKFSLKFKLRKIEQRRSRISSSQNIFGLYTFIRQ